MDDEVRQDIEAGNATRDNEAEIKWPEIDCQEISYAPKTAEIEPGESEIFHFDFILSNDVEVIQVYSFFNNNTKKVAGWPCTTIIDLKEKEGTNNVNQTTATQTPCS
jgi:hypothetical protein